MWKQKQYDLFLKLIFMTKTKNLSIELAENKKSNK